MGKKRRKAPKVRCYYCEREFEDEKILIQHQKAKHFKCHVCHKKLSTAGGMVVHVLQLHKESITKVPNSKPERESTALEIYGMEGIPPEILAAHDGDECGFDDAEEEKLLKAAKSEVAPITTIGSLPFGGSGTFGSTAFGMAPQSMYATPMYTPTTASHWSVTWPPTVPGPQTCPSMPMHVRPTALPVGPPPQPLFPIQNAGTHPPPAVPSQSPQPLFPIQPPLPFTPSPALPTSQPLCPINMPLPGLASTPLSIPASKTSTTGNAAQIVQERNLSPNGQISKSSERLLPVYSEDPHPSSIVVGGPNSPVGMTAISASTHTYASGPHIGGQSIGPPPVISNKPPPSARVTTEVYLVWDDEVMSMEERRICCSRY